MMTLYLDTRQQHSNDYSIPKLVTFYPVKRDWWPRLKFPIRPQEVEVESAQLRILAPATGNHTSFRIQVTQILGARRRRVLEEKLIHLSPTLPKWCEFEVTSAVQSWLNGERNLGIELVCLECRNNYLTPLQAAVSALVYPEHRRSKRATSPYQSLRRTDCRKLRKGTRRVCCRHDMEVTFSKLRFIEMGSIVQPKSYDAGFCQGQCPPNFNYATNHSRIQSLLHQMEWKTGKRNRRAVPKACCAPSKLEPLEILRVNPSDTTKLIVEKWDNMQVVECACS
ncbi:bone morphogenetic protein 6 isoform X2 [Tribolium madens]|nr:bone morphogenetic protein 6 isoform X2 [Tribolium madens]XP_044257502.1 bone morphogenetic protein 6 isoform X2 [Tribolium madens]